MHKLTFHNLGNADSTRIDLDNGMKLLIDFGDQRDAKDLTDKRVDLSQTLRDDLKQSGKDCFDVTVFTHLDSDHIQRSSDFFEFDHAKKYQGGDRIKMPMMWVPAAALLETNNKGDAAVIQAEAKHRLKNDYGIRVFSSPGMLDTWFKKNNIDPEDRRHAITRAGETVPGFSLDDQGVEFFCHSPFATRSDDGKRLDRNDDAIALHVTFKYAGLITRALFFSDLSYDVIADIVNVTESHAKSDKSRLQRLMWDIQKISHHCSYRALASEKGKSKTQPDETVARLFESYAQHKAIIVSTSKPIPSDDSDDQPPHRQAAAYYRQSAADQFGEFKVTMEHPSKAKPKPLVIKIDSLGVAIEKEIVASTAAVASATAPRAGNKR